MGHGAGGFTQSTRVMGQHVVTQNAVSGHGVLSSNVIPNSNNFLATNGKNSGIALGQMPMQGQQMIMGPNGPQKAPNRLHTSTGGRGASCQRGTNMLRGGPNSNQNQFNGTQIGIIGNTVHHQSGLPPTSGYADSANINIDSKQIALSGASASMGGIIKDHVSIEQAEFQMQQEMLQGHLQNQTAVAQFTHGEFNSRPPQMMQQNNGNMPQ